MIVNVNYIAVLLSGIATMIIGFIWYSPALFGKKWAKLMRYTDESLKAAQKKMGPMYGLSFVAALIMAFVLRHFIAYSQVANSATSLAAGIQTGFWVWLGFIMPVQLTDMIFGGKHWKVFAINTGYQLASAIAMGAILGIWS